MLGFFILYLTEPCGDFERLGVGERQLQPCFEDSERCQQGAPVLKYSVYDAARQSPEIGICLVVGFAVAYFYLAALSEEFVCEVGESAVAHGLELVVALFLLLAMFGLVEGQHHDSGHEGVVGGCHFLAREHESATDRRHGPLFLAVHAHFTPAAVVPYTFEKFDFLRVDVLLELVDVNHGIRYLGDRFAERGLCRVPKVDRLGIDLKGCDDGARHLGFSSCRWPEHVENRHVLDRCAHDVRK